jgi:tetratricopeptide (TPR) repeat protein
VFRLVRREALLLSFLACFAVAAYFCTRAMAASNRAIKEKAAAAWFQQGTRNEKKGQANEAVAAFRKATANDRANQTYLLSLARALQAARRDNEARELLLQIRENIPENPEINLELARISAREKDTSEALRYYHNALYGIWTGDDIDKQRQQIRRELIEFLISQNAEQQALSETIALSAHLPSTAEDHLQLAELFFRVDDLSNALENYKWVLRREPRDQVALLGAGKAAFKLGNYDAAKRFLNTIGGRNREAEDMLETSRLVLDSDPLGPRLTETERWRRVGEDLKEASSSVENCAMRQSDGAATQKLQNVLDELTKQRRALFAARKSPDPNMVFSSLDAVYSAEIALTSSCGPLSDRDAALLLVAQKSRGMEP